MMRGDLDALAVTAAIAVAEVSHRVATTQVRCKSFSNLHTPEHGCFR
jgi:hypothetical protein